MIRGIMALEENADLAGVEAPVEAGSEDALAFVESAEAPLIEMTEAETEIAATDAAIDTAVAATDTLDEIAVEVEGAIETDGGLDESAAALTDLAVESIRVGLGFARRDKAKRKSALEAFGDKASRVQASKLALEDIQKTAASIWEAIKNAFTKAVEWVKQFFAKLLDATKRFEARGKAVSAAAKEKAGKTAPVDTKVNSGAYKALAIDGKLPNGGSLPSIYAKATKETLVAEADVKAGAEAISGAVAATLANPETAYTAPNKDFSASGGPDGFKAPEGATVTHLDLPFGDQALYQLSGAKAKIWVGKKAGAKEFTAEDVAPLTADEAGKLADAVVIHMQEWQKSKAALELVSKAEKEVLGKLKEVGKGKDVSEAGSKNLKDAANGARALVGIMTTTLSQLRGYDIRVAKAALDLAGKSVKLAA